MHEESSVYTISYNSLLLKSFVNIICKNKLIKTAICTPCSYEMNLASALVSKQNQIVSHLSPFFRLWFLTSVCKYSGES